jgi:hypothetical protein
MFFKLGISSSVYNPIMLEGTLSKAAENRSSLLSAPSTLRIQVHWMKFPYFLYPNDYEQSNVSKGENKDARFTIRLRIFLRRITDSQEILGRKHAMDTVDLRTLVLEDSIAFDEPYDVCNAKCEVLHENGTLGRGEFSLGEVVDKGVELEE